LTPSAAVATMARGRTRQRLAGLSPGSRAPRGGPPAADYEIGPGDVLRSSSSASGDDGSFAVDAEHAGLPRLASQGLEHTTLDLERKLTTLLATEPEHPSHLPWRYGTRRFSWPARCPARGSTPSRPDRSLLRCSATAAVGRGRTRVIVVRPHPPPPTSPGAAFPGSSMPDDAILFPATPRPGRGIPRGERARPAARPPGSTTTPPRPRHPGTSFVAPDRRSSGEPPRAAVRNPERTFVRPGHRLLPRRAGLRNGSVAARSLRFQEGNDVLQALTLAGEPRHAARRVEPSHPDRGRRKVEKKAKATDLVLPEDTLVGPERSLVSYNQP